MSDVWRELEERLKQKTKTDIQIYGQSTFSNELWVRLEDVKEAIQQLKQNYEIEAIKCLIEILDNAKDIEGKAEEIKEFNDNLHAFLEFRAMKISDNVTKLRKVLGLKPLSEYNLKELLKDG